MNKPPWEIIVDQYFEQLNDCIFKFTEGMEFRKHWSSGNILDPVCIKALIRQRLQAIQFVIMTPTINTILKVVEHGLFLQLDFIVCSYYNAEFVNTLFACASQNTVKSIEDFKQDLYKEYKTLYHHVEKIQIQWRKCISNPEYAICRKRLLDEYQNMTQ
jgi:hypothetical protein